VTAFDGGKVAAIRGFADISSGNFAGSSDGTFAGDTAVAAEVTAKSLAPGTAARFCEELISREEGHPSEKSKKPTIQRTWINGEQRKFFVFILEFLILQLL
jgi:hypothetical protein